MATRSGKEPAGKRPSGKPAPAGHTAEDRRDASRVRAPAGNSQAGTRPSPGRSPQPVATPEDHQLEREDGKAGAGKRSSGPRRVLIFAGTLKEAAAIAKRKEYPRDLWRFVTGPADTDVDPREWATITVVGFGRGRPLAKDAYDNFQARCRGYGIKVPSYDP